MKEVLRLGHVREYRKVAVTVVRDGATKTVPWWLVKRRKARNEKIVCAEGTSVSGQFGDSHVVLNMWDKVALDILRELGMSLPEVRNVSFQSKFDEARAAWVAKGWLKSR